MTTCQNLIDETKRYLFAGQREPLAQISGSVGTSDTSINLTNAPGALQAGSYLSVDLEIMYVWSISGGGASATVQRGMLGSTAATHNNGALVTVNPKFPDFAIFQALNSDLDALSSPRNGLYRLGEVTFTYNAAIYGYDLTGVTGLIDVLRVRYNMPGPWRLWPEVRSWAVKRQSDTSIFPSGYQLLLYEPAWPGRDVRVEYASRFTHFAATSDDVTTTGLPVTAYDLPPLGAALRLSGVRETQRNFNESQGDTRRAGEIPPNAQTAGMRALQLLRDDRIRTEAGLLLRQYPPRRRNTA